MQPRHAAVAALSIAVMAALVSVGGHAVLQSGDAAPQPQPTPSLEPAMAAIAAKPAVKTTPLTSRAIDPEIVAPPQVQVGGLERVEPRAPLSKLALAVPPKPKMPDEWKGTPLFQPVASAAGLIQAKDYSIALSGVDPVMDGETCDYDGKLWDCGTRARTAFRAFLRGRAVVCTVPPQGGRDTIAAQCRIGNQDLGQWLVENGWARAAAGGPYVEAGDKARSAAKGIFGAPPDLSGMPSMPAPVAAQPASPGSILDLSGQADAGQDGSGDVITPPAAQPAPVQ